MYTPAIDIWSIGSIFAELLTGKPLFPGKNVVHQLDLMTYMLGTPYAEAIGRVRKNKARRYLRSMRKKKHISFLHKFSYGDPLALCLLEKMLSFEPKDRPTAEEALADPYFKGLAKVEIESPLLNICELFIHSEGAVEHFKKQFAYLEEHFYRNGLAFCTLITRMERGDNRVQCKSLMDFPSVASEMRVCGADKNQQRIPVNVPQTIQGCYNNCGAATVVEALEKQ
ncbi:unnamed protein product [Eruca vesicaria subsp. sativa]|uniref:Protein kinase domain-containing protein n=1 Tax=Eruca vesicaria subsp. sativa TaxID=29727 RepID=A0ABC8JBD8_ERUVS|nr:unnamed protein product [Eruca vesicaria subsp. sativa]